MRTEWERAKVSQRRGRISYYGEETVPGDENFQGVTEKVGDGCGREKVSADAEVKGLRSQSVGWIACVD